MISVTLLVIAMPPIPDAGILVYTILFVQLGIAEEAIVLVAAIDIIVDYRNTGFNVLLLNRQMASEAASLDSMDRAILMNDDMGC